MAKDTAKDVWQLARQMGPRRGAGGVGRMDDDGRAVAGAAGPRDDAQQRANETVRQDQAPTAPLSEREQVRAFWDRTAAAGVAARTGTPVQARAGRTRPMQARGGSSRRASSRTVRTASGAAPAASEIVAVVAGRQGCAGASARRGWGYLQGVYRNPYAACATLDELVKSQGWTSATARVTANPLQLGALRGKEGFFAGAKTRAERETTQRAAGAIGPSLERIGAARS